MRTDMLAPGTQPAQAQPTQEQLAPVPLLTWAATLVRGLEPSIAMVTWQAGHSWQESIIIEVNSAFEQHFGWCRSELSMSSTPAILLSDATNMVTLMHLDAALSLSNTAKIRLYCVSRTGHPSLCDMSLTVLHQSVHGMGSSSIRCCLCVCSPHQLPAFDFTDFPTSTNPWLGPPQLLCFDRNRMAQANQARDDLVRFLATQDDTGDKCAVILVEEVDPFQIIYASRRWLSMFGYRWDEVCNKPCFKVLRGEATCSRTSAALQAALRDGCDLMVRLVQQKNMQSQQPMSATIALRRLQYSSAVHDPEVHSRLSLHRLKAQGATAGQAAGLTGLIYSTVNEVDLPLVKLTLQSPEVSPGGAEELIVPDQRTVPSLSRPSHPDAQSLQHQSKTDVLSSADPQQAIVESFATHAGLQVSAVQCRANPITSVRAPATAPAPDDGPLSSLMPPPPPRPRKRLASEK